MKQRINTFIFKVLIVIFSCAACSQTTKTKFGVQPIFSDNMVLQQGKEIPVWGTAPPRSGIEIQFRNQKVKTKADSRGKWLARLQPENVSLNEKMTIQCGNKKLTFSNVAVGEVWIASGQSNMEVPLVNDWAPVKNGIQEAANANFPDIRLFSVGHNSSNRPVDTLESAGWKPCTPTTIRNFSAIAYFFGREIHQDLEVPVGLIQSTWGGTLAEAWTSAASLELMEDFTRSVQKLQSMPTDLETQQKIYEKDKFDLNIERSRKDPGIMGSDTLFIKTLLRETDWDTIHLPDFWENSRLGVFDGSVWFRKHVEIPFGEASAEFTLGLGSPEDLYEVWINGRKIAQSQMWSPAKQYKIPTGVLRSGDNAITLRVTDFQGSGGFNGKPSDFFLSSEGGFFADLGGKWFMHAGYNQREIETIALEPGDPNRPSTLFNGMINPLIPFAFKGVIWYQGESNTGMAWQYRHLFTNLINDWREKWKEGDFPFYYVQLANYMKYKPYPADDMWAELRESQTLALELPETGMAVSIDIGEAENIHPANKQDVGKRLSLLALNKTYGKDIPSSGPVFSSYTAGNGSISLFFENVYGGLKINDGSKLNGFAIAGEDKHFVWADAEIVGNTVIVKNKDIPLPVAVRYNWSANPNGNLVNSANLPASPFRTDDWDLITK